MGRALISRIESKASPERASIQIQASFHRSCTSCRRRRRHPPRLGAGLLLQLEGDGGRQKASYRGAFLALCLLVPFLRGAAAIRFVIDREECFSHNVDYEGDTVHVSFVVIKADTPWHYTQHGVDLVVKDHRGGQIHDSRDKISDKFEFTVQKRGVHRFCFTNK